MNTLELDSVILEFDRRKILQDVHVKVEKGKVTGLLGRNGTGKSCIMKILYGELTPKNKFLRMNGRPVRGTTRSPKDMMYLPQATFVPNSLTIKQVFYDFTLDFSDFTSWFPAFNTYGQSKMNHLSAGERRILEIYLIVASSTKFCLLDEPFSQLMPIHIQQIKKLISQEKENKGILITDHFHKHMIDICDHLYVIKEGRTHLIQPAQPLETLTTVQSLIGIPPWETL